MKADEKSKQDERVQLKVEVDRALRRNLKLAAVERGVSVRSIVEGLLVDELNRKRKDAR